MVICLQRSANDLPVVQLMALSQCHPAIYCFTKIQNGLTFLVPAYPGLFWKKAAKRVSIVILRL